jgi:Tol biopolymer transport system component
MKLPLLTLLFFVLANVACKNKPAEVKNSTSAPDSLTALPEPARILEKEGVKYAYPHWSADGKRILYQTNESGKWQIAMMDADGKNNHILFKDTFNSNFMDWSPDNKKICFVSDRDGNEEIYIMDANGMNQRRITHDPGRDIHPYFTPDGSRIYFNSSRGENGDLNIWEMNTEGAELKQITRSTDDETCARLSPDGHSLLYLRNNALGFDDVMVLDLNNLVESNISQTKEPDGWPCWGPNGAYIVFSTAFTAEHFQLWKYDIITSEKTELSAPNLGLSDGRANVDADGKKIIFNRENTTLPNTIGIYSQAIH